MGNSMGERKKYTKKTFSDGQSASLGPRYNSNMAKVSNVEWPQQKKFFRSLFFWPTQSFDGKKEKHVLKDVGQAKNYLASKIYFCDHLSIGTFAMLLL